LGAQLVEEPYVTISQISTTLYFSYFLIILPLLSYIESTALSTDSIRVSMFRTSRSKPETLIMENRKNFSTKHGQNKKGLVNKLKDFFTNLYVYFNNAQKKSEDRFKGVIETDHILVLLDTTGSRALRLGFILYFCNCYLFREDIIAVAGVIQFISFSSTIVCGFLYLFYFFSQKKF
jgi:hypothetical protein